MKERQRVREDSCFWSHNELLIRHEVRKRKKEEKRKLSRAHHSSWAGGAGQVCFLFLIFFMTDCPFKLLASLILLYHFPGPGMGIPETTGEEIASISRHGDMMLTYGRVNVMSRWWADKYIFDKYMCIMGLTTVGCESLKVCQSFQRLHLAFDKLRN